MDEILISDLTKACKTPASRISETASGLGLVRGNEGRRLRKLTVAEAIRIAVTRELMAAGLPAAAALDIGRQIEERDIVDIAANEKRAWLLVRKDEGGPAEYVFTIASLKEAIEIFMDEPDDVVTQVTNGEQPRSIRIVDLYKVIRAVFIAAAERQASEAAAKRKGATVSGYQTAERNVHGAVVEDLGQEIGLAVVKFGKGQRLRMSPAEARLLGEKLISMAAERDAPAPGDLN